MKVIAVNSSARVGGLSKTELMLNKLIEGMKQADAEVEIVNLKEKKIKYCIGCYTCWSKTPGRCIHNDDMSNEIFPRFLEADLAVLATPLYHFTVNAALKTFIERTLPAIEPFIRQKNGQSYHPLRGRHPFMSILSVAGFPDEWVFDQMSSYIKFLYGKGLAAEIYRPGAELLVNPMFKDKLDDVLDATRQAGYELATGLKINDETMARIRQPVENPEPLFEIANSMWEICNEEGLTPAQFYEKSYLPRPSSMESFLVLMQMGFNAEKAVNDNVVVQFDFSGNVEGSCSIAIRNGKLDADVAKAENPDLTIIAPFDVWMDVITRKLDGQQAFMENKWRVEGDMGRMEIFQRLFG